MNYNVSIEFNNERDICVSDYDDDNQVGSVDAWLVVDEIQINDVFVDSEFRRQGIAYAMLNRLFDFARESSCKRISLEVREGNVPARKLYEKLGFHQVGERKNYYQDNNETAILMDAEL